jgi:precorrin-2 dehydrogenase/sirohydrochlorin ferrochelatase
MNRGRRSAYPIVLTSLGDALCAVIGGGRVAERKVLGLGESGARRIRVVAPTLTPTLRQLEQERMFDWLPRRYRAGDLATAFLAVAATNDPATNRSVAAEADDLGILVDVVDAPESGNFAVPASIRRGDLLLTVSTGGTSPTLAKRIRNELDDRYGPEYGRLLETLGRLRPLVTARIALAEGRRCFWRSVTSKPVLAAIRNGHAERVETMAAELLEQQAASAGDKRSRRVEESDAAPVATATS